MSFHMEDTILIAGSGKSFSSIRLDIHYPFDAFFLNYAFRYCFDYKFSSFLYASFDLSVISCVLDDLLATSSTDDVFFSRLFLLDSPLVDSIVSDRICRCRFRPRLGLHDAVFDRNSYYVPFYFSGVNAAYIALLLGYKNILLAGIDCSYPRVSQETCHDTLSAYDSSLANYFHGAYHRPWRSCFIRCQCAISIR